MRTLTNSELTAVFGGGMEDDDDSSSSINCNDMPMTCFMQDLVGAAEAMTELIVAAWTAIYTAIDIIACNVTPAEVREAITDWLGIPDPCKNRVPPPN